MKSFWFALLSSVLAAVSDATRAHSEKIAVEQDKKLPSGI